MSTPNQFSEADLERIKAAVRKAEDGCSGEIVPVIVPISGHYTIANYAASLAVATATFFLLVVFNRVMPSLAIQDTLILFLLVIAMGIVGAIVPNFSDGIKRLLITQGHMEHATRQQATSAFLEQEVFNTRHRTGILIFVSFFEHEVIIMVDRGIGKVVEQKAWDSIVRDLTDGIRKGRVVDGLEMAIWRCGEILKERGFTEIKNTGNELHDDLRID